MTAIPFVVGGWIEPRGSRPFFGALLLGAYGADGRLQFTGRVAAGFSDAELGRLWKRLHALRTRTSPFASPPRTTSKPHWVKPRLVIDVEAGGRTATGARKHPRFVAIRDDIRPADVTAPARKVTVAAVPSPTDSRRTSDERRHGSNPGSLAQAADKTSKALSKAAVAALLEQLDAIDDAGGDGVLELPGGERLEITNLGKVFWPQLRATKGALFRHYVRAAPYILPVLADRPLVMKRYPNGIAQKPFYQHRAPDKLPPGVRVGMVTTENERRPHVIGGDLKTLLYTAQLASISQDPWFSRVGREGIIDHVAIDLDPPDGLPFAKVLDVARWVRDVLGALKAPAFAKTSGSGGLHVYVPMPADTPFEAGLVFAQIVATRVAHQHPAAATVERSVSARGRRIYVDYLQNVQGKTLASAYSPRANEFAGVSTPVTWEEIDAGVKPQDFTILNFAERLADVGDLWAGLRKAKPVDLRSVM